MPGQSMRRFAMPLPCHIAVVNDAHFNLAVQNARVSRLAGNGNSDLCPGDRLNQRSSNLFRIRKFPPTPSQSAKPDPMEIASGCTPLMAFNRKHVQITHSLRQDSGPYLLLVSGIATIHGERFAMDLGPCSTRVATSWSSIGNFLALLLEKWRSTCLPTGMGSSDGGTDNLEVFTMLR